ncbi:Chemosensory protein 15 [Operophtera brumata]|uniref:Chemosensory protein 15 n=1 Tax=Operophtera brumata TaxID=104452 RepID=A0A0L7K2C9_OPEBR|nr:Chemosensory protein 15 [Operophtera brumata]
MFVVLIFSYLLLSIVLADEKSYDRRYDYFEVDYFVNNHRTACEKCTPLQKKFTKKAFDAFKTSLPESHAELKRKYDPRNMYYDTFETAIAI